MRLVAVPIIPGQRGVPQCIVIASTIPYIVVKPGRVSDIMHVILARMRASSVKRAQPFPIALGSRSNNLTNRSFWYVPVING